MERLIGEILRYFGIIVILTLSWPSVLWSQDEAGSGMAPPESALGLLEVVELTLANDPNIALVESGLDSARGALLGASGLFDPLVSANLNRDRTEAPQSDGSVRATTSLTSTVGLTRQLRRGLSLTPSLDLERSGDGADAVNVATVSFIVRQPLLRGRGRQVVAAGESAAEREVEASRLDLEHTTAERLTAVLTQYWIVTAALFDLEVLRRTEESSRELLETTRRLIAADITPAAEIVQLEADLASKEVDRIAGEQTLFRAQQGLGREIGLTPDAISTLPLPGEAFPRIAPEDVPPASRAAGPYIAQALERRADLRAARERMGAAEILLVAAENARKTRLDLVFTPSYSGLSMGNAADDFFSPVFRDIPGLSTTLGFELSWPTLNRQAEGSLIQARATVEQRGLGVELAMKTIGADVPTALDAVRQSVLQLGAITRAVGFFEETVENELKKLRAGSSTLIDVITQRDRLTGVRRQQVALQRTLAVALVELRFQTGTLFAPGGDSPSGAARAIAREQLTTLPL